MTTQPAASGVSLLASNLPAVDATPAANRKVELAIASICCDGFGDENFTYAFDAIPKLGFTNVEFNVWYPRNLTPAGIASIKHRCRQHNLKPVCLQASSFAGGSKDAILKDVTHKLWLMECCKTLGCTRIKCTGAKRNTAGGLDDVVRILKELAPAAEQYDMLLLVENHFGNVIELPEDYDRIFSAIPSKNVGMCLDPAHFAASGVDLDNLVARFHHRILHIDLKDLQKPGATKWAKFGQGIVDLHKLCQSMINDHHYTGYLCVELSLQDRKTMMDDLRTGYEMFKKYEA